MHEFLYSKTSKVKTFLWERKQPKSSKNACSILRDSSGKTKAEGWKRERVDLKEKKKITHQEQIHILARFIQD